MLAEFFRRIRYWLANGGGRADLEEEMRLHMALRAGTLRARGMAHAEADATARRRFGNQLQLQERSREMWVSRWLDEFAGDVRIALRGLRRNSGFTAVALSTLALGIGANTAIFQLVDAIRLRSLPVKDPHQLALVQLADRKGWRGSETKPWPTLTNPQWEYFRDHQDIFSAALAWSSHTMGLGTDPRPVRGLFVSGDFFRVLGLAPQLGRFFTAEEDRRGCGLPGVVLSHAFWRNEFAGDNAIIGRKLTLNQHAVQVVGVAGPEFTGLEVGRGFDVAVPICSQATLWNAGNWLDEGAVWWLTVMGRNAANQDVAAVDARLRASSAALFEGTLSPKYPRENIADYLKMTLRATPGGAGVSDLRKPYEDPLILLFAATGLVLLLACANLGNMILARASVREHEFALRLSIGASRGRLLRQLMVENGLLALGGACAGLFLANLLGRFLIAFLETEGDSLLIDLRPGGRLIAFSAVVAAGCCLVFGLLPAWRASRTDAGHALKATGRATATRSGSVLRQVLVVAQVTFSLVLVFGALLFSRTLGNVLAVDAGFRHAGVLTAWIDYSRLNVPAGARLSFERELLETIRATLGVVSAGETDVIPLSGNGGGSNVWLEGAQRDRAIESRTHFIGDGYMETMGVRLLAGRDFDRSDTLARQRVAIVNETLAKQLGLGPNPIGHRFRKEANPWHPETAFEIVGLVNDTKYLSLKEESRPIAYYSTAQDSDPGPNVQLVIRASASDAATALRTTLKAKYPAIGMDFRWLETMIRNGLLRERLLATVSGFFGLLAALIAAVGLYGVISYLVIRRTNKIGIRMALGATPRRIVQIVVWRATLLVTIGVMTGAVAGVAAARAARSMLFQLEPYDPATLVLAAFALIVVALAASFVPSLRAARLDPLAALRMD